jgi:hypothetical protein
MLMEASEELVHQIDVYRVTRGVHTECLENVLENWRDFLQIRVYCMARVYSKVPQSVYSIFNYHFMKLNIVHIIVLKHA